MASNKRERELARMRAERQAQRRAAAEQARRQRRRNALAIGGTLLALALVAALVLKLTGGDDKKDSVTQAGASPSATASASAAASAAPGTCAYSKSGTASKKVDGLPPTKPTVAASVPVSLTTNRGEIQLTLEGKKAPCTTGSFAFLAGQKYFDGTSCHRLTTSGIFVLQCGDPSGTGGGGPGYQFADENLNALGAGQQVVYPRGTVAMANAGPGTNGSQFFLVYKDSPLAPSYTPFGRITKGLDLLDAVAKGGSTPASDGKPKLGVTIQRATVG